MSSETAEDRVRYQEAVAREVCRTWQETNNCLKPTVEILEGCFDMKEGVILEGLEIIYREFCFDGAEAEHELIECIKSKLNTLDEV